MKHHLRLFLETMKILRDDQLSRAAGGCPSGQTSQSSENPDASKVC